MLRNSNELSRRVLQVLVVFSVLLSAFFTIQLCWSLRPAISSVVLGGVFEAAKIIFWPFGIALIFSAGTSTAQRIGGVSLCGLSVALVLVSLAASIGWFSSVEESMLRASPEYLAKQASVLGLEEHTRLLSKSSEADLASKYTRVRERGLKTAETISQLRERIERERFELASFKSIKAQNASALFLLFGVSPDFASRMVHATLALLLELVSLASITLLHSKGRPVSLKEKRTQSITEGRSDTGVSENAGTRYSAVVEAITNGVIQPSYRAIQGRFGTGQVVARRYLQSMVEEGVLLKCGNRFTVVKEVGNA